jgi:hypothetical protein
MLSSRASWQNPRVLTTLLLVFLAGGLVGAWTMRQVHRRAHFDGDFAVNSATHLSYDELKQSLDLTPDQANQLRSILDDFVKYNQELQAQVEDFRATGKNRIRSILNPDQQKRFEKLCAEIQTR